MQGETGRARLLWGFSDGEFVFSFLLLGALLGVYLSQVATMLPKFAEIEALSLSTRGKIYWAESWATDGVRDPSASRALDDDTTGKYVSAVAGDVADGSVHFEFNDSFDALAGSIVSFRPAFSAVETPYSLIWVCGHAPVPAGFTVRGQDLTNLPASLQTVSCRTLRH